MFSTLYIFVYSCISLRSYIFIYFAFYILAYRINVSLLFWFRLPVACQSYKEMDKESLKPFSPRWKENWDKYKDGELSLSCSTCDQIVPFFFSFFSLFIFYWYTAFLLHAALFFFHKLVIDMRMITFYRKFTK